MDSSAGPMGKKGRCLALCAISPLVPGPSGRRSTPIFIVRHNLHQQKGTTFVPTAFNVHALKESIANVPRLLNVISSTRTSRRTCCVGREGHRALHRVRFSLLRLCRSQRALHRDRFLLLRRSRHPDYRAHGWQYRRRVRTPGHLQQHQHRRRRLLRRVATTCIWTGHWRK